MHTYARNAESIAVKAQVNVLYVVRTRLPETEMGAAETVHNYNNLISVERGFGSLKSVDRMVRPVFHYC